MSGEDDLLERATRALRAAPPPTEDELRAARGRLLTAHVRAGKKSPARTLRWVLPLAAVLVAGSALAATTGQIDRVVRAVASLLQQPQRPEPRKAKKQRVPARAPEQAAPVEAPVPPLPTPPAPEEAPQEQQNPAQADAATERAPRRPARRRSTAAEPPAQSSEPVASAEAAGRDAQDAEQVEAPSASTPVPSEDLARYRQAHTAHFRQRDFRAALRGWDAYLSEFPAGVFAIEARYNRAICLVRLGRTEEARRALQPFARGQVGRAYRRAEATKLLEALE